MPRLDPPSQSRGLLETCPTHPFNPQESWLAMTMDTRRLVRALALTALLWLATTSLVVGVAAADEGEEGLVVPDPRPGDRATYRVSQVILDEDTAMGDLRALNEAAFEWLPETLVTDADFGTRGAHILRSAYFLGDEVYPHETAYDGATGQPLYGTQSSSYTVDGTNYGMVLEDLIGSEGYTTTWRAEWYTGAMGPCGVRPAFLASPQPGDIVPIAGNCDWPGGSELSLYRADGWRDEPHGYSFRFSSLQDDALHLWYDGQSPFPVRVESPLQDTVYRDYTYGRMFVLERIAFERGAEPYPAPTVQAGPGPAAIAPRPAWGIADEGVEHPFRLSEAYAAAVAEEDLPNSSAAGTDQTVPAFLADHPGAYLGYASYTDLVDSQGEHHHTWWMIFTDGQDRLGKRVELGPVGFSSVFLPAETAGDEVYVYDWTPSPDYAPADVRGLFPTPDFLPDQMPDAASLMQRYEAASGRAANSYGFQLRCATDACGAARAEGVAGYSTGDLYGAFNVFGDVVVEHNGVWDSIWVDGQGRLQRTYTAVTSSDTPVPIVQSNTGDQPAAAPAGTTGWVPTQWDAGTQAAAAGLGAFAVLVGVLYYLWPAAKGALGLGLFSRIEDDQVLDHPTRRRIHDAIQAEPGIHFQALSRKAGVGRGALDHHLRKLVAADVVTVRKAPGYTCYFPKGRLDRRFLDAAPAVRSEGSKAVLQAVATRPGTSSRDLALGLGMAPSTVSYHIKRLQAAGLVSPGDVGVHLTPLGAQAQAAAA